MLYPFTDAAPATDSHGEPGVAVFVHARDIEAVLYLLDGAGGTEAETLARRIRSAASLARITPTPTPGNPAKE